MSRVGACVADISEGFFRHAFPGGEEFVATLLVEVEAAAWASVLVVDFIGCCATLISGSASFVTLGGVFLIGREIDRSAGMDDNTLSGLFVDEVIRRGEWYL